MPMALQSPDSKYLHDAGVMSRQPAHVAAQLIKPICAPASEVLTVSQGENRHSLLFVFSSKLPHSRGSKWLLLLEFGVRGSDRPARQNTNLPEVGRPLATMKSTSVLATAVAALSTAVQGLNMAPRAAKQTASAVLADDGISPRPTPPPGWDRFEPENLFRRATTSKTPLTMMIAPDNTCGFISGSYAIPYTCGRSATCGIVQAQQTFSGMIMCFDSQAFNFRFACVDNAMYQSSSCDHLCAENTQILKW